MQVPAQRQAKRKHEAIPEVAQELADAPTNLLDVGRAKPSEALTLLGNYVGAEGRDTWQKRARIAAVLGSCPKSRAFFLAGGPGPSRLSNVSVQPHACLEASGIGSIMSESPKGWPRHPSQLRSTTSSVGP